MKDGSVAERSKALVLGTSLLGGVGSNPTAANRFCNGFNADYRSSEPLKIPCFVWTCYVDLVLRQPWDLVLATYSHCLGI